MNQKIIAKVTNLSKAFGKVQALDKVSLDVYEKEIVGFIGPNGAGKSTTMKCMSSLVFPDSGEIDINGYSLRTHRKGALESMAAIIESPGLFTELTGRENLKMIADIRGFDRQRVQDMISFIDIGKGIDRRVRGYSMGMKQRLALGIAIMSKPKFLILDEPTNGLDPTSVLALRTTIQDLVKHEGTSILLSSHQLGEIEKVANRIVCINKGKIINTPELVKEALSYHFKVSKADEALEALRGEVANADVQKIDDRHINIRITDEDCFSHIVLTLTKRRVHIYNISKHAVDIEEIYQSVYEV